MKFGYYLDHGTYHMFRCPECGEVMGTSGLITDSVFTTEKIIEYHESKRHRIRPEPWPTHYQFRGAWNLKTNINRFLV